MKALAHFITITKHRNTVMKECFQVGLYWQGLTHDLSKYSWTEFRIGAKYFQGDHSPNVEERNLYGYSTAWLHHKGRNRHHFEYWTDINAATGNMVSLKMPTKYLVEMCMDRIAACKTYHGKDYTDADPLAYLARGKDRGFMNPETRAELEYLLAMLRDHGEKETFAYIRDHVLRGEQIPKLKDPQET